MPIENKHVKELAVELGFDACGVSQAVAISDTTVPIARWLAAGFHADMHYMEQHLDKRMDPRQLLDGAQSIISVVRGYNPQTIMTGKHRIARYAYGDDYHTHMRRDLYRLASALGIEGKVCVDTVPFFDKYWAMQSGLGWIGHNTLLVTPQWGSWVNIGAIVTTAQCDHYDQPISSQCSGCNRCVEACPNHALTGGEVPMLDSRRCTSYNTIENRSPTLPSELDRRNYAFGCDICQEACPFNHRDGMKTITIPTARIAELEHLDKATPAEFRHTTKHSAMNRITYNQWKRNTEIK